MEKAKVNRLSMQELTTALDKHEKDCLRCRTKICKYNSNSFYCLQEKDIAAYQELKEFREAEEQGLFVKLPCKVGELVWTIISQRDSFTDQPYKIVTRIHFRLDMLEKIGKSVFITREEAEKAFAEMEK